MINAYTIKDEISSLLDEIYLSQMDLFGKAAKLIKQTLDSNGKIFFFGQGHSVWVGKDVSGNYLDNIIYGEEISKDVNEIYEGYKLNSNDLIIIVSNSGINPLVVDLGIMAKEKGNKLIVINSNKHTMEAKSRHPSKTKLYQYGDVAIDNCCKYGDVALKEGEDDLFSLSSITNNLIAHTIIQKALEEK